MIQIPLFMMRSLESDPQADPVEDCILAYARTVEGYSKIPLNSVTENEATTRLCSRSVRSLPFQTSQRPVGQTPTL